MELTIHTGTAGEETIINIDWFNENGVKRKDELRIEINEQDKPRTMEIVLNGVKIGEVKANRKQIERCE